MLTFAGVSQAGLIGEIDFATIGGQDTLLATTGLSPSNPSIETDWANSIIQDDDVTFTVKTDYTDEGDGAFNFYSVSGSDDLFAFSFASTEPGYFLLKNGSQEVNSALYQNNTSLDWGVISFSQLWADGFFNGNYDEVKLNWFDVVSVSHLTEFNGETVTIPEPATIGLFGLGLFGLGLARRKRTIAAN
ncbi:hypothetical protein MED297_19607 [Reinekea sp. MED297]|uniref:Ice-binding protein C-terminal domain-containing protein n=2 Tax=Reinekea TaxID=230494 RepID=A4B926_9GAMM|nr:hypothetical protein MED297_19607 [Reinekea sp. MED297] [Reinekea blandensis MED297]